MTQPRIREKLSKQDAVSFRIPWYQNNHLLFLLFNCVFAVIFYSILRELMVSSWNSGYTTYIPLIPIITFYLLYTEREKIYSQKRAITASAIMIAAVCAALYAILKAGSHPEGHTVRFALIVMTMILMWQGGFLFCYGMRTFKAALFPLMFLFFAVPIPETILDAMIAFLQRGSAEIAYFMINIGGVPMIRDGYVFHLPTIDIEVAPQCSGIRSALSLVVTGSLAGYFFLRKGWTRTILIITLLPITIIKNAFRIASLTLFGFYVDPRILDSDLHKKGGVLFFIIALIMVGGVIVMLRKLEDRHDTAIPVDKAAR